MKTNQLFPIIRRIRRPLVPVEAESAKTATTAVVENVEAAPVVTTAPVEQEPAAPVVETKPTRKRNAKADSK
jgi:hypothetical protein